MYSLLLVWIYLYSILIFLVVFCSEWENIVCMYIFVHVHYCFVRVAALWFEFCFIYDMKKKKQHNILDILVLKRILLNILLSVNTCNNACTYVILISYWVEFKCEILSLSFFSGILNYNVYTDLSMHQWCFVLSVL